MMQQTWLDCRLTVEGKHVCIENSALSTYWQLNSLGLALIAVKNRASGFCWQNQSGAAVLPACMTFPDKLPSWETEIVQDTLTAPHWVIRCCWKNGSRTLQRTFSLYPTCPFLTMWAQWQNPDPEIFYDTTRGSTPSGLEQDISCHSDSVIPGDIMAAISLPEGHLRWRIVRFADQTDVHDTLVFEQTALVYPFEQLEVSGNLFSVEEISSGEGILCARHAPITPALGAQFQIRNKVLCVLQNGCAGILPDSSTGCSCVIGVGKQSVLQQAYRRFYRLGWQAPWQEHALLLSNTWGDRNRDSRVTDSFIRQEIDRAAQIGLDVVQIDDGWQNGITVNSASASGGVWEGYYAEQADFWEPHPTRFPKGLTPLIQYAESLGIQLGLWFSPDSSHGFINWRRDVQTVLHYFKLGISVFKLDGVNLTTPTSRCNYQHFLSEVTHQSGNRLVLQQDITAQQRMGYFSRREIGTLFVENRYTDFHNYFPYRTLRNLWMLSHWIPSQRLLFELLNPMRNRSLYEGDLQAPDLYSMDYLFAITMVGQPLFWMELSSLSEEQISKLKPIIQVFRKYRNEIWTCDVQPIGQEPDGFSFPGFLLTNLSDGGKSGFLLVFRENSPLEDCTFDFPLCNSPAFIFSNNPVHVVSCEEQAIKIHFSEPHCFAFYHWQL